MRHTVKKWAEAGTVLLGKLATHEFAFGGPSFDLPWPPARNPWNREHFTAGSSSGTGAAVAAGLILGGTGSDTGGSIRGPAALCGIAGIKPTYGLVSRAGILPLAVQPRPCRADGLDGPRTARCCCRPWPATIREDPASADRPVADFTAEHRQGREGPAHRRGAPLLRDRPSARPTRRAQASTPRWTSSARKAPRCATSRCRRPPTTTRVGYLLMITEAFTLHAPWMRDALQRLWRAVPRPRRAGARPSAAPDIVQATRRRRLLCREMATAMADLDIIVSASQPGEAPHIAEVPKWANMEKPSFTMPFNVTGFPAISICTGFGEGGLPVSMQLAGKPFTEPTLFRAAHAYETATPWRKKRPAMAA